MDATTRGSILVVSDEPELQAMMAGALHAMQFDVVLAIDLGEAVLRIGEREPRLVCVDLSLPRGGGLEICEFVRAEPGRAAVQILVMSDRVTPEDMADAEEVGANAFVRKPFTVRVLERYIVAMLEHRAPSRTFIRELRPSTMPPPDR